MRVTHHLLLGGWVGFSVCRGDGFDGTPPRGVPFDNTSPLFTQPLHPPPPRVTQDHPPKLVIFPPLSMLCGDRDQTERSLQNQKQTTASIERNNRQRLNEYIRLHALCWYNKRLTPLFSLLEGVQLFLKIISHYLYLAGLLRCLFWSRRRSINVANDWIERHPQRNMLNH